VQFESQDAAFAGAVTLTLSQRSFFDDRPALLELRWPVQLPAGGQDDVWLLVPGGLGPESLRIDAGALSPAASGLRRSGRAQAGPVALVLSASPEGWGFLRQWRPHSGGVFGDRDPLQAVYLTDPRSVPPWFLGYQGAELVAIAPDFPLDRLSAAQLRALAAYARDGGRLVVPESPPAAWRGTSLTAVLSRTPAVAPRAVAIAMSESNAPDPNRFAAVAPALGLERARLPGPDRFAPPAPLSPADALREQALAAVSEMAVSFPSRWMGLAAGAYALAGWAWVRSFPRWRARIWSGAGLVVAGAASAGALLLGASFFEQADRPQAVLLVRPATLTDPQRGELAVQADDPVQAELLLNLPGLVPTPWEISPSAGEGELFPSPLWPAELAPGTGGVRFQPAPGPDGGTAWLVEPLGQPPPSAPAEPAGGWPAVFYVDAPLVDLAEKISPTARAAIVSSAGAAAVSRADLTFRGRVALFGAPAAQAVALAERPALYPGPEVLEGKLVEALTAPRAAPDARLVRLAASAASRVAPAAGERPARYAVLVGRTSVPVAQARRPGGPWRPVRPYVVLITAAVPAATPARPGGSPP
ncbi:MAG: hypothetical protein AB1609_18275, partial [Bacillota bacterium]